MYGENFYLKLYQIVCVWMCGLRLIWANLLRMPLFAVYLTLPNNKYFDRGVGHACGNRSVASLSS